MLINIARETLNSFPILEKDNPAIIMSQNVAEMLVHLIISCSLATVEFSSCDYALWFCQYVGMLKLHKKTLYLSPHSDVEA